ncbi:MAG: hypothetical protein NC122_04205 [Faecalibacterium sp.]|nr:hypothetical protein [Ruminococcus sp.]MCM1392203.1 hypothetical protein [Ruminococcus sp.]MCM1485387.1 hypothetical protein [Faecalibacterium sp.]
MEKDFLNGKKQFINDSDFDEGQIFGFPVQRSKEHDESQRFTAESENSKNQEN